MPHTKELLLFTDAETWRNYFTGIRWLECWQSTSPQAEQHDHQILWREPLAKDTTLDQSSGKVGHQTSSEKRQISFPDSGFDPHRSPRQIDCSQQRSIPGWPSRESSLTYKRDQIGRIVEWDSKLHTGEIHIANEASGRDLHHFQQR